MNNLVFKRFGPFVLAFAALAIALGFRGVPPAVIEAQEFRLVDRHGHEIASLKALPLGGSILHLKGAQKPTSAFDPGGVNLVVSDQGSGLALADGQGRTRLLVEVDKEGDASIQAWSKTGENSTDLKLSSDVEVTEYSNGKPIRSTKWPLK